MPLSFDRLLGRIKDNPVLALILVFGTAVIALSTFTDAARNLMGLFQRETTAQRDSSGDSRTGDSANGASKKPDIAGKWKSGVLANPFDESDKYTLLFTFQLQGDNLLGSLTQTPERNAYHPYTRSIWEASLKGNQLSFYTRERSDVGEKTVDYKDYYYGEVSGDTIQFTLQSDRPWNFPPQKFSATRQPAGQP